MSTAVQLGRGEIKRQQQRWKDNIWCHWQQKKAEIVTHRQVSARQMKEFSEADTKIKNC